MHDHLNKAPPRLRTFCPDLPEPFEAAIMSALTKNPRKRPTAREFLTSLETAYKESRPPEEPASAHSGKQKQTAVVVFAEFRNQPAEPRANTMPIPVPPQGFVAIAMADGEPLERAPSQPPPPEVDEEEEEAATLDLEVLQRQDTQDEPDPTAQVLNQHALEQLQRLGLLNGNDVAPELVQVFRRDSELRMRALRQAIGARETSAIERIAHSLKSSCGNLGAERMQSLCQILESASKQGRHVSLDRMLMRLEQELAIFNIALDEYLHRSTEQAAQSARTQPAEASQV